MAVSPRVILAALLMLSLQGWLGCSREAPGGGSGHPSATVGSSPLPTSHVPIPSSSVVASATPRASSAKPGAADLAKLAKSIDLCWGEGFATVNNRGHWAIRHVSFAYDIRDQSGKRLDGGTYNLTLGELAPGASKKVKLQPSQASRKPGAKTEMSVTWLILPDGTEWKGSPLP